MGTIAMLSFRLGGTDGVSIVGDRWARILTGQGWDVVTVAGEGPVDRIVAGLAIGAAEPPSPGEVEAALEDADLVIVENLLTIPMNLPASAVVADVLRGRPALLHHHDPPWQRDRFDHVTELPVDDPAWRHVTINQLTEGQFRDRGITTHTLYNPFDTDEPSGDRDAERQMICAEAGVDVDEAVILSHPVRAIERKNVPGAIQICERLATSVDRSVIYWLPGPAEENYAETLAEILTATSIRSVRTKPTSMADLYAASDLVLFPSTWEGFGNVPVESSIHHRPVVVGQYAVADELAALGFDWLGSAEDDAITQAVTDPSVYAERARHNADVARKYLSVKVVGDQMTSLFQEFGWSP